MTYEARKVTGAKLRAERCERRIGGMEYPQKDSVLRAFVSTCCTCVPGVSPRLREKVKNSSLQFVIRLGFTFPYHKHSPSQKFKLHPVFLISNSVSFELFAPVCRSCFWQIRNPAAVLVPKATVHKYDFSPAGKNDIRTSGKRLSMQTISEAFGMDQPTDKQLRPGVFASYSRHHPASMFWREAVHDRIRGLRSRRVNARQVRQRHNAPGDHPSRPGRAR